MNILVTGGTGYVGSHTVIELVGAGHKVHVIDNQSNSNANEVIGRIEDITHSSVPLHIFDLQNPKKLDMLFKEASFDAVIHFAGLKAVGESIQKPLLYYRTNIDASLTLLETMQKYDVKNLVFSSSATVYGSAPIPYSETSPIGQGITNPYGQTKYMIEQMIRDTAAADPQCKFATLRYFNPIGAHESGKIGEDPRGVPNNIMPFIAQVAAGKRDYLSIFGDDYDTADGTCIRDYIHISDLAKGHLAAIERLRPGVASYNLGSGNGVSVMELVRTFEKVSGKNIPYKITGRRAGDLPEFYANPSKAYAELSWKVEKTIEDACRDTWRWQSLNPNGFTN